MNCGNDLQYLQMICPMCETLFTFPPRSKTIGPPTFLGAKVNPSDRDPVVIGTVTHLGTRSATAVPILDTFSAATPLRLRLKLPGARDCIFRGGGGGRGGCLGGWVSEPIS